MHTLVTGGGGFLGLYVVEQLRERGHDVRVFCRGTYPRLEELGVQTVQGDLRERNAVVAACEGVETVFHVAGKPGIWGPKDEYLAVNTTGTENVLAGCREHGVRRLVFTSSPSVVHDGESHVDASELMPYPDEWLSHYSRSKALAEQAVIAANDENLATCALRPHLVWGPRDNHLLPRIVGKANSGRLRRVGDGSNMVSVTYVENAAAAHLLAAEKLEPGSRVAGQVYFVNEPKPVNLWDFVDELLKRAGLPKLQKSISQANATRIGAFLEGVWWTLRLPGEPPMTRFVASELAESHSYDCSKAQRDFGYEPIVSMDEALRRTEPYLKELHQPRP